MKYTSFIIALLATILILAGCQKPGAAAPAPKAEGGESAVSETTPSEREITIPVIVQEIALSNLSQYVNITGTLEGATDIVMSSETSGRIVELHKNLGDWVAAGEAIGRVDNESQRIQVEQSEASLMAAEADFEAAQQDWRAAQELFARESISEWEHSQKKSALKSAQARLNGAQAELELARQAYDNSRFVAPVSGYITALPIEVGETINMGQQVCSIVNPRRLVIKTGVGESHIAVIHEGKAVQIEHPSLDKPVQGRITGVGIKPVNGSASYPVEISLDNPDEALFPGMVVDGRIESDVFQNIVSIPKNAVLESYTGPYVYVVNDEFLSLERQVHLGIVIGDMVIVKSGLEPGDKLVTEGMDNLQDGARVVIRQAAN